MWSEMSTIETTGIHGKLLFKDISEWHYDNDSDWVTNKKNVSNLFWKSDICFMTMSNALQI